jgi:hypothetical protein
MKPRTSEFPNPYYEEDIKVPCPNKKCKAEVGQPCNIASDLNPTIIHFGRRVKRLLREKNLALHPSSFPHDWENI